MEHYVVRVYRRGEGGSDGLVGTVEPVEGAEPRPFRSLDELWQALRLGSAGADVPASPPRAKSGAATREDVARSG